jgi:hypothetical protein
MLTCPAHGGSRVLQNNGTYLSEQRKLSSLSAHNHTRLDDQKTVIPDDHRTIIHFLAGGNFLLATVIRLVLRLTQLPLQWAHEAISLAAKQKKHAANCSLPSSARGYGRQDVHLHSPRHNFYGA